MLAPIDPDKDFQFNLRSNPQMQEFLFEHMQLEPIKDKNEKGNYSVAEDVLTHYAEKEDVEFCQLLLDFRKIEKAQGTYLKGITRALEDGDFIIHPNFWLNTTETYRSSSTDPNFQNIPKHADIIKGLPWKLIRKLFTTRPGFLLAEGDYEQAEVKTSAMLSDDPQLIEDCNTDLDMHSHWAIELFGLQGLSYAQVKENHDEERFLAKNNFTFANFYGAWNKSIAEEMRKFDFYKTYVYEKFFKQLAKPANWELYFIEFSEAHIERCQEAFYGRYQILKRWQDAIVKQYYQDGYVANPFGFRRRYPLKRNEIINYPIQSTAFLMLLDSCILISNELSNSHWESKMIGQIHDAINGLIRNHEAGEFLEMADYYMTNKDHLPFTHKVKMETEWEFGLNWLDMKKVKGYKEVLDNIN